MPAIFAALIPTACRSMAWVERSGTFDIRTVCSGDRHLRTTIRRRRGPIAWATAPGRSLHAASADIVHRRSVGVAYADSRSKLLPADTPRVAKRMRTCGVADH